MYSDPDMGGVAVPMVESSDGPIDVPNVESSDELDDDHDNYRSEDSDDDPPYNPNSEEQDVGLSEHDISEDASLVEGIAHRMAYSA